MALIICPKCGKQFSDYAQACPQCGTSKEEVQRLIKEQVERKAAERERIRKEREAKEAEEARIRAEKRAAWWKKYKMLVIAIVLILLALYGGSVVYINTMPISARNSTELQSALQNPLRFSKEFVVKIPDGETSICDSAFYECSSLISIEIPNSVTSIGDYAFNGCSSLVSVTIPTSVISIGYWAFYGCTGLPVENNIRYADTYLVEAIDKNMSTCHIKEGTKWIGDGAFRWCSLTSVMIPNSVTIIGGNAFEGCKGLTSVTIPNSVTSIGDYAFRDCTGLTSVTIPSSATSIGVWAFAGCTGLTSVTIPNSITSIGDDAFGSIPNIVYNGSAAGAPWGARSLNGFVEGWFVYSDDTKNRLLACSSSASGDILIPNSVTSIGKYAFYECKSLTSVMIPNSVISIGDRAFFYCTGLRSVTIANGVTSIDRCAFWGRMSSLTLKIPERFRGKVNVSDCKEVIYY